ncbi:DUF6517 family protein [Halobiforma nitratireducens]|uniref:Uncharacterized protein n=1 Tax=Halobiforma nitratireducens JCM 10879 TaxID=1227454 RepID=M0M617_9EURY|nr:DUF6517 family protein [Halobiforma nitratireducens]EMA40044.1 hypothetical protein C446_07734 [Halobiforma nitratireducens JCM 10879]
MKRRTFVAGAGITSLTALSGCLGLVGMDEHTASPAGVASEAREETGYERAAVGPVVLEESVDVGPYAETITVTNYLTEHEKSVDVGPLVEQQAAVFMVLSTPQISVAGQQFNPVEELSATELVDLLEDNYDDIGDVTFESEESITVLGEPTTVSRFAADAEFDGIDLEVDLHVTEAVPSGGDLIVTIAVYPRELRAREEAYVHRLAESVVPELDESAGDGEDGGDEDNDPDDGDDGESNDDSEDESEDENEEEDETEHEDEDENEDADEDDGIGIELSLTG